MHDLRLNDNYPPAAPTGMVKAVLSSLFWAFIVLTMLTLTLLLAAAPEVRAQDGTVVDAAPFITSLIQIVAPVILTALSVLVAWVLQRVGARTGLSIDAGHRAAIEQAMSRAVGYAATHLEDRIAGGIPINLRSEAIAAAARYAEKAVPGALRHFKVTPERLSEMVEARLEGLLVDPDHERAEGARLHRMAAPIAGV